jgi:hypothetical protein
MATRRGFLGALFGGAAATAGGLLIPKAVAAREKIEVTATSDIMDEILKAQDGEVVVCNVPAIPDYFFEERAHLYQQWWNEAGPKMVRMQQDEFDEFIVAHDKVNKRFGVWETAEKEFGVEPEDEYF